jgi:hypothetical protein
MAADRRAKSWVDSLAPRSEIVRAETTETIYGRADIMLKQTESMLKATPGAAFSMIVWRRLVSPGHCAGR